MAGVQRSLRFSPENCAQGTTSELVHCRGATPNFGSSTTEVSSDVRLPSKASDLLRKTPGLLSDHVERIRNGLHHASQRKPPTSPSCWIDSFGLSSVGAILAPPIVTTEPWFRRHSHKPRFRLLLRFQEVFIDADTIKRFLTDVNTYIEFYIFHHQITFGVNPFTVSIA